MKILTIDEANLVANFLFGILDQDLTIINEKDNHIFVRRSCPLTKTKFEKHLSMEFANELLEVINADNGYN